MPPGRGWSRVAPGAGALLGVLLGVVLTPSNVYAGLKIGWAFNMSIIALLIGFGFWQGLLRVVGSFGDCPRCLAVCPVGNDYHAHLADIQKHIPEKTPEKVAKAAAFKQARKSGDDVPGLSAWNQRWVGEKGYQGIVARQLQEFKRLQKEKEKQ